MNATVKMRMNTQLAKIACWMKRTRKYVIAADFNGADPRAPYVGYEAATRLGDLVRSGIISTKPRGRRLRNGQVVSIYRIIPQRTFSVSRDHKQLSIF